MPQADSRSTTDKAQPTPRPNHHATALRAVLAKAPTSPVPPKRDLNRLLAAAWKSYASNRPEFEQRSAAKNCRLYAALRQTNAPKTPDLKAWFAIDDLVTTDLDDIVSNRDAKTFSKVGNLQSEIAKTNCADLRDLVAMANACAAANSDLWNGPLADLDWDKKFVRHLVEAVLSVAGERNVLDGLPIPQAIEQDAMQRVSEEREQGLNNQ